MSPDQQPTEERRQSVTRAEHTLLEQRVERIESVVWGVESLGLKGLLSRMTSIESGIASIKETLEKQDHARDKMLTALRWLLVGLGGNIGLKLGEIAGWW